MIAKCLSPGGTVGICSPSHIADRERYHRIILGLQAKGYRVVEAENLYKDTYGYLASPRERAADFNQLIADPTVELVFFGGGEGSNELLPYIDYDAIRRNPKRICGFSDGTTILNAVWAVTRLETYYGQSPSLFEDISDYDERQFVSHLVEGTAAKHVPNSPWQVQTVGVGTGILVGGYARNVALMLGSRYFPIDWDKKYILFIEDHEQFGGVAYVSAMLTHIELSGFMGSVAGLIFGNYSDDPHPELLARLRRLGERYGIPVVYCDDFGHGSNHAIFPIGRTATLDTGKPELVY